MPEPTPVPTPASTPASTPLTDAPPGAGSDPAESEAEAGTAAARAAEAREYAEAEVRQRRDAAEAGRDRLELLDQQAREAGAEAARLQSERDDVASGAVMYEEYSEVHLRRALMTLQRAEQMAALRFAELTDGHALSHSESTERDVLLRDATCWRALQKFDEAAEPPDERGRRRLRVCYFKGGNAANGGRGRHFAQGGFFDEDKWRTASLQGCPHEVRALLAAGYYYDVDMVNSLPNIAKQLTKLGMVEARHVSSLTDLCARRDETLQMLVEHYNLRGKPALGKTARDVAKDLPIRLLHGGTYEEWLAAHGIDLETDVPKPAFVA